MSVWRISGKLAFTPAEDMNLIIPKIEKVVQEHCLSEIIKGDSYWDYGVIQIDSRPKEFLTDTELTSRLREFIVVEEIKEIGLEGNLRVQFNEKRYDLGVNVAAGYLTCKEIKPSHSSDALLASFIASYSMKTNSD